MLSLQTFVTLARQSNNNHHHTMMTIAQVQQQQTLARKVFFVDEKNEQIVRMQGGPLANIFSSRNQTVNMTF